VSATRQARVLVVSALVASLALTSIYLAAGGASYVPAKTLDPCKHRPWRNPQGIEGMVEQFSISALDGAACELGVSRERLARALATPRSRDRFMQRYRIDDAELARALRAGLVRAVDDAEAAGALSPLLAGPLREAVRRVPLDQAIELIQDARTLLDNVQRFLEPARGLLEQFLPGLSP